MEEKNMTLEEEKLWRMSDEDLEDKVFEEKTKEAENEEVSETNVNNDDNTQEREEQSEKVEETEEKEKAEEAEEIEDNTEDQNVEEDNQNKISLKPLRVDGMDLPIKSLDDLYQMASMGYNYRKKIADFAPYRRAISAMKENNITDADISLIIDLKKGDKGAIAKILKDNNIDPLDFDINEHKYEAKIYGDDENIASIKEIENEISNDPEYRITANVINKLWDAQSQTILAQNPQLIKALHLDIKNGIYEKIAPEAARLEFLDGGNKSKLEYYIQAAKELADQENKNSGKQLKNDGIINQKRRAAASTKSRATKVFNEEPDWINMSDEEYDKYYRKTLLS